MNEAAEEGRATFDVEEIVDQLIERILVKRPMPLESDCLVDVCIQERKENKMCFCIQIVACGGSTTQVYGLKFFPCSFSSFIQLSALSTKGKSYLIRLFLVWLSVNHS